MHAYKNPIQKCNIHTRVNRGEREVCSQHNTSQVKGKCRAGSNMYTQLSNHYASCFHLSSGGQFQFRQAGCGVQSSARGLQAPAESTHRRESNLARWPRAEVSRRSSGEASAAAGHRGPAGTESRRHLLLFTLHTQEIKWCRNES